MFKIKDTSPNVLKEMGFVRSEDGDFILRKVIDGSMRNVFTIYRGSEYLRVVKTSYYIFIEALHYIHEWTKKDYIEWED